MPNEQHWTIVATPAERWNLAIFLMHKDLMFKTRKEQRELYRARLALGLIPPTEAFLGEKKGRVPLALNKDVHNLFTATAEIADFFIGCLNRDKLELSGVQLAGLEHVLQQLEDKSFAHEEVDAHPDATEWKAAAEDWSPTLAPTVEQPDKLVDVLADCIRSAQGSFDAFSKSFLAEAAPSQAGRVAGRLAESADA
jgi:hypothetical protein